MDKNFSDNVLPHNKNEILKIFERYDFRDKLGHKLLLCNEFVQLVNWYDTHSQEYDRVKHD